MPGAASEEMARPLLSRLVKLASAMIIVSSTSSGSEKSSCTRYRVSGVVQGSLLPGREALVIFELYGADFVFAEPGQVRGDSAVLPAVTRLVDEGDGEINYFLQSGVEQGAGAHERRVKGSEALHGFRPVRHYAEKVIGARLAFEVRQNRIQGRFNAFRFDCHGFNIGACDAGVCIGRY